MNTRILRLALWILPGTFCGLPAIGAAPAILEQPVSVTETVGGAVALRVRAQGTMPLSYQWYRDGAPLAGNTHAWLALVPLTSSHAGTYTVRVTDAAGTMESSAARVDVAPAPPPLVDPTFRADAAIDIVPTLVLALPDDRIIIVDRAAGRVLRLLSDGRIDPTFQAPTFTGTPPRPWVESPAWIDAAVVQPDGGLVLGGGFTTVGGVPRPGLARLMADGSLDPAFTPDPAATESGTYSLTYTLALQPDGRLLVASGGPSVLRLLPDGQRDPSFAPAAIRLIDGDGNERRTNVIGVALGTDGSIFAAAEYGLTWAPAGILVSGGAVVKLAPDGTVDATYARPSTRTRFIGMQPLADGSLMLATRRAEFRRRVTEIRRYRPDGMLDPGYPVTEWPGTAQLFYPDGRLVFVSSVSPVRLTKDGAPDPTFTGGIGEPRAFARTAGDRLVVAGNFELYNGTSSHRVARLNPVSSEATNAPRILEFVTDNTTVHYGEPITVRALVTGSGPLTFEWWGPFAFGSPGATRTTEPTITFAFREPNERTELTVRALNTRGQATSEPLSFTVTPDPPRITHQPTRVSAQSGRDVLIMVERNRTSGEVEFEWRRDGRTLSADARIEVTRDTLSIGNVAAADAGTYTLTLRNVLGASVTTAPIVLTIDDSSRFTNLSTRVLVRADEPAIAGFVVAGNRRRFVIIRAIGPRLTDFGVGNPLPDPQLSLYTSSGELIHSSSNDDWQDLSDIEGIRLKPTFARIGAFSLPDGSKDAASVAALTPGPYTVHVSAKPGQSGIALLEIYEADNDAARMLNVSTRAFVGDGEAVPISGLGIRGPVAKRVLLRAVGPGLASFSVPGTLPNPRLTVQDEAGGVIGRNDDWDVGPDMNALRAVTLETGAFPLTVGSKDAALLLTLPPGNYTVTVEGAAGESGIVLVEAYEVP